MRARSYCLSLLACLFAGSAALPALATPLPAPIPPPSAGPGKVSIDAFENATQATVTYNDGAGHSGTDNTLLSQFLVTYMNGDYSTASFQTFCIDLFDNVGVGQSYAVQPRDNLASAFTNGAALAYIFQNYGSTDLGSDPDQAAAVQLSLWDLSLDNHSPTGFVADGDGTYSSGDPNVFKVDLGSNPDAAAIAGLVNAYLAAAQGATNTGDWLDSSGDPSGSRGQSLLIPSPFEIVPGTNDLTPTNEPPASFNAPEPGALWVMLMGLMGLGVVRAACAPLISLVCRFW